MTKRPTSHVLEARSRDRIRAKFHDAGFVVDDIHQDYGEDLMVRVFREGKATPYSFFIQAKATEGQRGEEFDSVRVASDNFRHWKLLTQPVFLVLWNSGLDSSTWESIHNLAEKMPDRPDRGTVSLRIPSTNVFDETAVQRMAIIARDHYVQSRKERDGAALLCSLLERYSSVKVEEYSARNEIVFLRDAHGEIVMHFFGELAELCRLKGLTDEDVLALMFNGLHHPNERPHKVDDQIICLNEQGEEVRRFVSHAEYQQVLRVERETFDIEALLSTLRRKR